MLFELKSVIIIIIRFLSQILKNVDEPMDSKYKCNNVKQEVIKIIFKAKNKKKITIKKK